jgi:hypothetical protein
MSVSIPHFTGNVASHATQGLEFFYHLPLVSNPLIHSVVDHFSAWDVTDGINIGTWSGDLMVQNSTLSANPNLPGTGIVPGGGGYTSGVQLVNDTVTGFNIGYTLPDRGVETVTGGYWDNVTNFNIVNMVSNLVSNRLVQFFGPIMFGPHSQTNYYVAPYDLINAYGGLNTDFVSQQIILPDGSELYAPNQLPSYVPFATGGSAIPSALVGLTNQQLWNQFGLAPEGALATSNAAPLAGSNGLDGTPNPFVYYYRLYSPAQAPAAQPYQLKYVTEVNGGGGAVVTDPNPVTLQVGWNVITRVIGGQTYSWSVQGY